APVQITSLSGVIAVGGGKLHSLAAKSDGTAWAWGEGSLGELGDGTATDRTAPVQVSGLTGITVLAGGELHSLARKSDGTVWAWGSNADGQLGDGTTQQRNAPVQVTGLAGAVTVTAGWSHSAVVKDALTTADSTLYGYDRLSHLTSVDAPGTAEDTTYTIDPVGNRLTKVRVTSTSYTYVSGGIICTWNGGIA
ncbi:MAG TPA: RCC1 repeat-containing protein, partial [Dehalococcoidia bacterium]|nr:RCC1 repeat-containing protein [Dehalococcoidia bacterium]